MLVISREQLDAFIPSDGDELVRLITVAIKKANPMRTLDHDPELLAGKMIATGIERAKSYGLTKPEDVAAFVAVMFEVAPNFDEQQEINAILNDVTFPRPERF